MSAGEAMATLFFDVVDEPTAAGVAALMQRHPAAADVVLAYLRGRHVSGVAPTEPWETTATLSQVMGLILAAAGDRAGRELIAIALGAPDPRRLRGLADVVLAALTPDQLALGLLAALEPGVTAAVRRNALDLVYHTYDAAADDYAASAALMAPLTAALAPTAA